MAHRLLSLLLGLALLLATPSLVAPRAATFAPTTAAAPSQPPPPVTGPGSDDTRFPAARGTHYGPDPGGYWVWEPVTGSGAGTPVAQGPFPVVLLLYGCCGNGDWPSPEEVDPWMSHLARQGYVAIAPVYRHGTPLEDGTARLTEALAELTQPGHAGIDLTRFAVIGYSYGGLPAILYAASAEGEGLPVPQALFLMAPCTQNGFCLDPPATTPVLPAGLKAVELAFADDDVIGADQPRIVYHELLSLPAADRDFVTMASDAHGQPPIVAHHQTPYEDWDAADWYGIWKLSDALFACTFAGQWCEYALGDTPAQRSMGAWSDGVPVTELDVTDDPGLPA